MHADLVVASRDEEESMLKQVFVAALAAVLWSSGCATAPETPSDQQNLETQASATLDAMAARDARIPRLVAESHGYVVFPEIGKGGALVGGAHGLGVVYENGAPIGYVVMNQGSIGAQLGGQTFSELVLFRTGAALERLKASNFELGGDASAVMLTRGGGRALTFERGVAVFVLPRGGLMVDLSVSGQQLDFQPRG
jgi:lipid-binding SYLF domain-containing protein